MNSDKKILGSMENRIKNPFEPIHHPIEYRVFENVVGAIDRYMTETYPEHTKSMADTINRIMKASRSLDEKLSKQEDLYEKWHEDSRDRMISEINQFIQFTYPDFSDNLKKTALEIEKNATKNQKVLDEIEKKIKKLFESSSLCEDVYKMRDDLKDCKTKMDAITTKMKKIFS